MSCDRCKEVHEAQSKGLTQEMCKCTCHYNITYPTDFPTNPQPIYPWSPYPWYPGPIYTVPNTTCGGDTSVYGLCYCTANYPGHTHNKKD